MTSGQETERVNSYNPEAQKGHSMAKCIRVQTRPQFNTILSSVFQDNLAKSVPELQTTLDFNL